MVLDSFRPLTDLPFIGHAFSTRAGTTPSAVPSLAQVLNQLGYREEQAVTAEQVHGAGIALATAAARQLPGIDGLVTRIVGLPLVVRCADCAAVFLVDRVTPAIGLVHSGRAGTAANAAGATVAAMGWHFGTDPANCRAVISPCIGPCHYEMDLWAAIETQLREAGVTEVHNGRVCTACHLDRYYSYRAEKGQAARMHAVLILQPGSGVSAAH